MAAPCSKAEYLKKYLSVNAEEKKKKRKKKPGVPAIVPKSRIVDDDVDFNSLLPENLSNTLEEDVGDNEPLVADVVDERPEHVKLLEKYRKSGAWKVMGKDKAGDDDGDSDSAYGRVRHDSDSDQSPARRQRHDSDSDQSPVRKQRHDSDSDQSPVRKQRHDSDSDQSPVRRQRHDSDSDQSPVRRQRHDSDFDQSPPRRKRQDSDNDPPRKRSKTDRNQTGSSKRQQNSDSDQSPPRRRTHNDSNSDLSPPRKQTKKQRDSDSDYNHSRKQSSNRSSKSVRHRRDSDSDLSPPRPSSKNRSQSGALTSKEEKTLSGKRAGLSSAQEMRREAEELKRKEDENFKQISDERLGRGAETVFRDRKSGKRRNLDEERKRESEEAKAKAEEDEKYQNWGKGLKQIEKQTQHVEDALHEANKPLARYKDDDDLDDMLRNMDRAEDPMLAFITKKKSKSKGPAVKEKPRYKGPAGPPNRFQIMPGYRWDGVDRSNGFEKQMFALQSNRKAVANDAYKWSVEDM